MSFYRMIDWAATDDFNLLGIYSDSFVLFTSKNVNLFNFDTDMGDFFVMHPLDILRLFA